MIVEYEKVCGCVYGQLGVWSVLVFFSFFFQVLVLSFSKYLKLLFIHVSTSTQLV